jgi:hypothetical protein
MLGTAKPWNSAGSSARLVSQPNSSSELIA